MHETKLIGLILFSLCMLLYVFKVIGLPSCKWILTICTLFCSRSKPFKCPATNGIHARLIVEPRNSFIQIKTENGVWNVLTGLLLSDTLWKSAAFFFFVFSLPAYARSRPPVRTSAVNHRSPAAGHVILTSGPRRRRSSVTGGSPEWSSGGCNRLHRRSRIHRRPRRR